MLSAGKENKEKILELALKGNEIQTSSDIVKDPYVFEFLGLPEEKPIMESDLEKALITHIENFFAGAWERFYVCRFSTEGNFGKYTLLCGYGVL